LAPVYPLITRDPISGGELTVTRLACAQSGVVIEGNFSLGWIARLTPEQLDFVGSLLRNRGNVQRLATELGLAYNTARNRMDEIVVALEGAGGTAPPAPHPAERLAILGRLAAGEVSMEEALGLLEG
jgi:hypothetical protein